MKGFIEWWITVLSWLLNGFGVVGLAILICTEPQLWH